MLASNPRLCVCGSVPCVLCVTAGAVSLSILLLSQPGRMDFGIRGLPGITVVECRVGGILYGHLLPGGQFLVDALVQVFWDGRLAVTPVCVRVNGGYTSLVLGDFGILPERGSRNAEVGAREKVEGGILEVFRCVLLRVVGGMEGLRYEYSLQVFESAFELVKPIGEVDAVHLVREDRSHNSGTYLDWGDSSR